VAKKYAIVLIVDDEPANLSLMSHVLSENYQVLAANSGKQALLVANSTPVPDIILLDILMPEIDGYSVLTQLKNSPETCEIPIIFVTAMEEDEDEKKGLALGAVDYIMKPIKPEIMLARVKSQLILKQARDFLNDKNIYLEAEVTRRMKENQVIQNVSIRALAHLAEIRDPETGEHILRTQSYVNTLAIHLQDHPRFKDVVTENYIQLITKSAPLHDIGKVGVPDNILLKPGKLTKDEWLIMQSHAALGARSIEDAEIDVEQPVEFLALAKEIAHWHHECWDGSGYPDGLTGDDIPLSARIMAVADVFDALISKRVYKEAISFDQARKIIMSERNRQFDPDITDAFIECFEDFVDSAVKYKVHHHTCDI